MPLLLLVLEHVTGITPSFRGNDGAGVLNDDNNDDVGGCVIDTRRDPVVFDLDTWYGFLLFVVVVFI